MLSQHQAHQAVEMSIKTVSTHLAYIDPAQRLMDVGIDGAKMYVIPDLISLEINRLGYLIDVVMFRGHIRPDMRVSELSNFVTSNAFSNPPGPPGPIPTDIYVCPKGDFVWPRYSSGIPVPKCPYDGSTLSQK